MENNQDKEINELDSFLQGYDEYVSGKDSKNEQTEVKESKNDETVSISETGDLDKFDSLIDQMVGNTAKNKTQPEVIDETIETKTVNQPSQIEKEQKQITVDKEKKGKKCKSKKPQLSEEELKKKAEIRESYLKDHKKFYIGVGGLVLTLWASTGVLGYCLGELTHVVKDYNFESEIYDLKKENQELHSDIYYLEYEKEMLQYKLDQLNALKDQYNMYLEEKEFKDQRISDLSNIVKDLNDELQEVENENNNLKYDKESLNTLIEDLMCIKTVLEEENANLELNIEELKNQIAELESKIPTDPTETTSEYLEKSEEEMGN